MTKEQLEKQIGLLKDNITALEDRNRHLEERAIDRDSWVRRFEEEKQKHRETFKISSELQTNVWNLEEALKQARLTIAKLMTQNVRLQGRIEGVLIMTGHLRLKEMDK